MYYTIPMSYQSALSNLDTIWREHTIFIYCFYVWIAFPVSNDYILLYSNTCFFQSTSDIQVPNLTNKVNPT